MDKKEERKDFFVKITTIQLILAAAIFCLCFFGGRAAGEDENRLAADYRRMTAQDMSLDDLKALFAQKGGNRTDEEGTTAPDETDKDAVAPTEEKTTAVFEPVTLPEASGLQLGLSKTGAASAAFLSAQLHTTPVFPVSGSISSSFGSRVSPIYHYDETHKGVDIAAKQGSTIRAVMDGVVSMVDRTPGRGNFIILDHGETAEGKIQTLYQHCDKILLDVGTVVRAGEAIALVGSTGDCTGPHLHLEYRVDGECRDPIAALFSDLNAV